MLWGAGGRYPDALCDLTVF